jgi:hypothetical protein
MRDEKKKEEFGGRSLVPGESEVQRFMVFPCSRHFVRPGGNFESLVLRMGHSRFFCQEKECPSAISVLDIALY